MLRKSVWRNTVSGAVSAHQDQALNTTIFLLKSYGPTGFLLQEDGQARNFRVCLGDPHTCTCPVFVKEQEPCKHICWVLLRKFKLPREHEYSFQRGLVERQISEVLHGLHQTRAKRMESDSSAASGTPSRPVAGQEAGSVCRKMIQAQDVCPICQEELLEKKLPVSYCRFGCGNNVHISCMKVWADHQRLSDKEETVKCPLCREDFASLKLLQEQVKNAAQLFAAAERERPDKHLGVQCSSCQISPITGKCFKCMVCSFFYLCEDCKKKGRHPPHQFASRANRRDRWRLRGEPEGAASPPADDSNFLVAADHLPESVLGSLPSVRVRSGSLLLDEGQQCRLCLQSFTLGQRLRTLPCRHKFHVGCVDEILRKLNSCPLDGYVIYNPLTWRTSEGKTSQKLASCLSSDFAKPGLSLKDLFVPGVALQDRNTKTPPSHGSLNLEVLTASSDTLNIPQKPTSGPLLGLCFTTTDAGTKGGKGVLQKKPRSVSKLEAGHGQSTCFSKETLDKRSPISPGMFVTVTKIREQQRQQPQENLSAALCRPGLSGAATMQLLKKHEDVNKKPTPDLTNTQRRRKTDTAS